MDGHVKKVAFLVVSMILGTTIGAGATEPPDGFVRGAAGPAVPLTCTIGTKELTDPDRVLRWTEPGCLESYVAELEEALTAAPEVASFQVRSGRIENIPPSAEWPVGLDPRHPGASSWVIPVSFERPLRWAPYVVTSISRLEATLPPAGGPGLEISKEDLLSTGMALRLSALGGAQIFDVALEWVAYDTTTGTP